MFTSKVHQSLKEKLLQDDKEISINSTSNTLWKDFPVAIKKEMGHYLLRPNVVNEKSPKYQVNVALSNRFNLDLPFRNRKTDDKYKYTKMPWIMAFGESGYVSNAINSINNSEQHSSSKEYLVGKYIVKFISIIFISVTALALTTACTPFGFFADSIRGLKRSYKNNKDEKLHKFILGRAEQKIF